MFVSEDVVVFSQKRENLMIKSKIKCGEIYMETDYLILICKFCDQNYDDLNKFLDHIYELHLSSLQKGEVDANLLLKSAYKDLEDQVVSSDICKNDVNDNLEINIKDKSHLISETQSDLKIKTNCIVSSKIMENIENDIKTPPIWQCEICFFNCTKYKDRKEHMKVHRADRKKKDEYICEICGKVFRCQSLNRRIIEHARTHTGEKPFKCDFCDLSFATKGAKRVHLNVHLGFKPYECEICSKKYRSKHALKIHKETHNNRNNEKIFECELCSRKFSCERGLKYHRKRDKCQKFRPKPFECPHCIKTFKKKAAWSEHIRLEHLGQYNYKCNYCDKVFIRVSLKRVHELIHSEEREQFVCNICPNGIEKIYKSRGALLNHKKKKHLNINNIIEEEFECKKCNQKFNREDYYQEHCRRHINEAKIFSCESCSEKFLTKYKLYCHLKKCKNDFNIVKRSKYS